MLQASERITTGAQRGQWSRRGHHSAALPQTRRRVAPGETGFRNSSQTASLSHRSLLRGTVSSDGKRLARRVPACPPEPSQEWPVSWRQPVRGISFLQFIIWLLHWMSEPTLDVRAKRRLRKGVPPSSDREVSFACPHGRRSSLRLRPRNIRRRSHATRRS